MSQLCPPNATRHQPYLDSHYDRLLTANEREAASRKLGGES